MTERKGKSDIIDVKGVLPGDDAFIRTVVWASRRLGEAFPYLILDARYEKVRKAGVITSQAELGGADRAR